MGLVAGRGAAQEIYIVDCGTGGSRLLRYQVIANGSMESKLVCRLDPLAEVIDSGNDAINTFLKTLKENIQSPCSQVFFGACEKVRNMDSSDIVIQKFEAQAKKVLHKNVVDMKVLTADKQVSK